MGGPGPFEAFFRSYVEAWASTPITSADFKAFFLQAFKDVPATQGIDWDTWFYAKGEPLCVCLVWRQAIRHSRSLRCS